MLYNKSAQLNTLLSMLMEFKWKKQAQLPSVSFMRFSLRTLSSLDKTSGVSTSAPYKFSLLSVRNWVLFFMLLLSRTYKDQFLLLIFASIAICTIDPARVYIHGV